VGWRQRRDALVSGLASAADDGGSAEVVSKIKGRTMAPTLKAKKSYTLSEQSVAFLETMRKRRRARSTSAVLEGILQSVRRNQKIQLLDQATEEYYSSLTDSERKEEAAWGAFALDEFVQQNR